MKRIHPRRALAGLIACAFVFLGSGCQPVTAPGAETVAGEYASDIFEIVQSDGAVVDLSHFSSFGGRLARDGTFSGELVAPVALVGTEVSVPVRVTGRWSFGDGVLTLNGAPATFLDGLTFAVHEEGLYGQSEVDGGTVRVRLLRR